MKWEIRANGKVAIILTGTTGFTDVILRVFREAGERGITVKVSGTAGTGDPEQHEQVTFSVDE